MTAPPGEPDTHRFAIETLKRRSRSLARAVARDPRVLDEIAEGSFATAHKPAEAYVQEALVLDPDDAYGELRRWRRRELIRIVLRDTATGDTSQTLRELSYLADAAIEAAGRYAVVGMAHRHGPPPCDWVVMALGNLGSSELNLSGDVDLIYVYESDEPPDAHRWFRRFFERLSRLLGDQTPDGFVYRIDLSLRPEGATGALCNSLDACERYYEAWGHPWERVAWLRARPVAGSASLGARVSAAMLPFVYRRSLDHRTLDELSVMKAEIDATAAESERDLKRGEGGIGAVEFFVHALQLVHGGRIPALRTRGTPDTLKRLALSGLVGEAERRALADAYLFFRAVENQLQLVEEEQTHTLPPDLEFVATALGTDAAALEGSLKRHREAVKTVWSRLFSGANALPRRERPWTAKEAEHLEALGRNPRSPWHESNRTRDADVARQLELALAEAADPEQALALLRDLVSALPGRGGFWPFLKAHPRRLRALVHLLGTSRFLGSLVARDPSLLEHVVLGAGGAARRSVQAVREALSELPEGAEAALKALRHRHDAELLRIGFFDVAGELSLEEVARELTGLADETIAAVLDVVRTEVDPEGTAGCVAVVAFGRLGAREMSWGSPVDLVFVYEGDMLRCSRLAQRVISGLSEHMTTGRLYEVDSRRRLDGPHRLAQTEGPELITPGALLAHHRQKPDLAEHVALLRARCVAGDSALGQVVDTCIGDVLDQPHQVADVHAEIRRRRQSLFDRFAREAGGEVDLKYGRGGLVEINLIIEAIRLLNGRSLPAHALSAPDALDLIENTGLLTAGVARAMAEAYYFLRKLESRLRIAFGRPITSVDCGGPAWELLARRAGYPDLPGRPGALALRDAYMRHTGAVRTIYDDTFGG